MTPTEPSGPGPADLGPEDEDAVRRLLADAGGPVPTPPEVQVRLEETLAGLVATRATTAPPEGRRTEPRPTEPDPDGADGPDGADPADGAGGAGGADGAVVTSLERARRRRWPALAAAAAAVAAVGYGTVTVVQQTGNGGAGDAGGAGTSTDTSGGQAEAGAGADAAEPPGTALGGTARLQREAPDAGAPPDVTPAFRGSVGSSAAPLPAAALIADALTPWALGSGGVMAAPSPGDAPVVLCAAPPVHADEQAYRVRFRGASATLVLGPVTLGRRVAVVYGCARARPLDATVLPDG